MNLDLNIWSKRMDGQRKFGIEILGESSDSPWRRMCYVLSL